MKKFGSLTTIEIASLTQEEITVYIKETQDENLVLEEVSSCRKRLDSMGIKY